MQKFDRVHLISILLFFGMLFGLFLLTIFLPKQERSEMENRSLAAFPEISWKNIMNRRFMSGFETYVEDHFVGRDSWVGLKGDVEVAMGKTENGGVYIGDNRLFLKLDPPDEAKVSDNLEGIRDFAGQYDLPIYLMVVPTASEIQRDWLPADAPVWDQQAFIESCYAALEDTVIPVDVYDTLAAHKEEALYYRTDHHWTTLGAYYAYLEAAEAMGLADAAGRTYTTEQVSDSFYGTLYSKVGYRHVDPDTIELYHPEGGDSPVELTRMEDEGAVYESLYFRDKLAERDQYQVFLGGVSPMTTIETGKEGKRLLVFKDSYADSLTPFLVEDYASITTIDLRYLNLPYDRFVDPNEFDEVLLVYNVQNFSGSDEVGKLGW